MFEEQKVEIRASSLDDLSLIIFSLKDMGEEFRSSGDNHTFDLMVDHEKLLVGIHLYKEDYDTTTEDEIDN